MSKRDELAKEMYAAYVATRGNIADIRPDDLFEFPKLAACWRALADWHLKQLSRVRRD